MATPAISFARIGSCRFADKDGVSVPVLSRAERAPTGIFAVPESLQEPAATGDLAGAEEFGTDEAPLWERVLPAIGPA